MLEGAVLVCEGSPKTLATAFDSVVREVGYTRSNEAADLVLSVYDAERGVAFIDIAPVSRARGAEPAMLADDGLHPSAAMYAEWARLALPAVRRMLSKDMLSKDMLFKGMLSEPSR